MKLVLFAGFLALAAAAPRPEGDAEVVVDERTDHGDGTFSYRFETTNGIREERNGVPGSLGQSNMDGSFSLTYPDGSTGDFIYVANEEGYSVQSDRLPVDHPLPGFVVELLAQVEELKRQGYSWDDKGNRLTRRK